MRSSERMRADHIEALRADLEALRRDVKGLVSNGLHRAGDAAHGTIDDAIAKAKHVNEVAMERGREAHELLAEAVAERPLTTIAVAAAAGFLAGKLAGWVHRD